MFKSLVLDRPNEHWQLILDLHNELDFFEGKTFKKISMHYFWHNRTEEVKDVAHSCKSCQLVKSTRNIKSKPEKFKSIPI